MLRVLFAVLYFALFPGCDREARAPVPTPPPTPAPAPEVAVDVEADVAAFLTPTAHPRQHGVLIQAAPENPDVQVIFKRSVVDPNRVNPCPVGPLSESGMTRQDFLQTFGPSAVESFEKIGSFDIPPDRPECAELRRELAQHRREYLAQQRQRTQAQQQQQH